MGLLDWLRGSPTTIGQADAAEERALDPRPFSMTVEDVFSITGRGTVATGTIETGVVRTGDTLEVVRASSAVLHVRVGGVEAFAKRLTTATAGDQVGLLLDCSREQLDRGTVLRAPTR